MHFFRRTAEGECAVFGVQRRSHDCGAFRIVFPQAVCSSGRITLSADEAKTPNLPVEAIVVNPNCSQTRRFSLRILNSYAPNQKRANSNNNKIRARNSAAVRRGG
jgi:hypothetical protein